MRRFSLLLGCLLVVSAALSVPLGARPVADGDVRELTERRTINTRTWVRADGAYRLEIGANPLHYKAADGTWQPISTALKASSREGYALADEANTLKVFLPDKATGLVRAETAGCALSFQAIGTAAVPADAAGNQARWAAAWPSTSLTYAATPGSLKETLVLSSAEGPAPFASPSEQTGLPRNCNATKACCSSEPRAPHL